MYITIAFLLTEITFLYPEQDKLFNNQKETSETL